MSTTPAGVTEGFKGTTEANFQSLFESGALNEGPTDPGRFEREEKPRATQPNPAEIEAAKTPDKPEVEALQPEGKEAPAEVEEGPEYSSLEEYLTQAKLDPQAFQALPVRVKIDGKEMDVPLADVIKSFQLEGHVQNKSQALAEQQRQFEQERDAAIGLYRQQLTNAQTLGQLAQAQLMGEFNQVNWTQLRQTDPVQWAVMQQDFNNRSAAINQHLREVAAAQEAQQQQLQQQQAALLPREREKMLEARPEWRDPVKFEADRKVMASYAKNLGFNDAELNSLADHRYMQVLHDAAQFRALQAANPETLKRVRAAPQMARPGTRTQRDPKTVAKQQAMERFNKNPRDLDAQSAFFETLV
jgi:hypothetical protein